MKQKAKYVSQAYLMRFVWTQSHNCVVRLHVYIQLNASFSDSKLQKNKQINEKANKQKAKRHPVSETDSNFRYYCLVYFWLSL